MSSNDHDEIVDAITTWWKDNQRSLPWRDVRDPWAILVSEIMAQQTQVDRVVPKWHAFLDRFPTPAAVANAPTSETVRLWDGLGYNRRAVMLHRCATALVDEHDGEVPDSLDDLMALPGIGPYTARAVLAFAFERDVAVVDTNVGRVLARLVGTPLSSREVQALADALVQPGSGWAWNQALLDFGATQCSKRQPSCGTCPAEPKCVWKGVGSDPAVGSAAVSVRQSTFEGSDRQGRGRLVQALRHAPVALGDASTIMGWTDESRTERVLAGLVADGLIERNGAVLRLLD